MSPTNFGAFLLSYDDTAKNYSFMLAPAKPMPFHTLKIRVIAPAVRMDETSATKINADVFYTAIEIYDPAQVREALAWMIHHS